MNQACELLKEMEEYNPELLRYIGGYVEEDYKQEPNRLEKLLRHLDSEIALEKLLDVKHEKKEQFAALLRERTGQSVNPNTIFIAEYDWTTEQSSYLKSGFFLIDRYLKIKEEKRKTYTGKQIPLTFLFPELRAHRQEAEFIGYLRELIQKDCETAPFLFVEIPVLTENRLRDAFVAACEIAEVHLEENNTKDVRRLLKKQEQFLHRLKLNGAVVIEYEMQSAKEHKIPMDIYGAAKNRVYEDYANRRKWSQNMLANIAGFWLENESIV